MQAINTHLKSLRIKAGLTQAELANLSGVSLRTLENLEQNHRNINRAEATTVIALAEALNCHPRELLNTAD